MCVCRIWRHINVLILTIFLTNRLLLLTSAQYDHCLWPTGCHRDDCCFNVVAKTGPVCDRLPGCAANFGPDCCRNARPVYTDFGIYYGYAISLDGPTGYQPFAKRYLEVWRGIPYARAPTRENNLRFRRPVPPPFSKSKHDATRYKAKCAQPTSSPTDPLQKWASSPHEWLKRLHPRESGDQFNAISEDCLYLNIYTLNESEAGGGGGSYPGRRRQLPILIFLDGTDHLTGSGNRYPGHVLAQFGVVVVFVNYRLGPFGFLATQSHSDGNHRATPMTDESADAALGNYGLWDQVRALEFIKENAAKFNGDPNQITLVGHGSAAADVALHLLSKHSGRRQPPLFHRAVLMSGSDQMEGGCTRNPDESLAYANELANQVGCPITSIRSMLACLRGRSTEELAIAGAQTRLHRPNWLMRPWSPTVDGEFLENDPARLWQERKFVHLPLIGGLTVDDGAVNSLASLFSLGNVTFAKQMESLFIHQEANGRIHPKANFTGLSVELIQLAFERMVRDDFALDPVAMTDTLSFEYTDWSNKTDAYKRWIMYRQALTDRRVGSGLIQTLRFHSKGVDPNPPNRTQMYVFAYKSEANPWTRILGASAGSELAYFFGLPRLTLHKTAEELRSEWPDDLGLDAPDWTYNKLDRNITDYMLFFLTNFVKNANATPYPVRNLTWDTYRPDNRTYLWLNLTSGYNQSRTNQPRKEALGLGAGFDLRQNYRTYHYAYWNRLYPIQLNWLPRFTPPTPTPVYVEDYRKASFSLAGILAILCLLTMAVLLLYCRRRRSLSA